MQRWGKTCLFQKFISYFWTEALRINATKFLLSSDLTKEAEIEDPNGQVDSDLDMDPKENTRFIINNVWSHIKSFRI